MMALFGRAGVVLVSIFVMISSFSSLNGSMLASPRVFFAMADDGLFFQAIAKVHPRYKTPYVAIILAAILGVALVMSRSFERLTDTFVLAIWPFYALGVAAIYRLRRLAAGSAAALPRDRVSGGPRHFHRLGRRVRHQLADATTRFRQRDHVRGDPRRPADLRARFRTSCALTRTFSSFLS